jgi:hypothetical protein
MPTLTERIDSQIASLTAERARIVAQAEANVADVDTKLAALGQAKTLVTRNIEAVYTTLLKMGLVKEI